MRTTSLTLYQFENSTYPINTHDGKRTCYCEILDRGINQLKMMLKHHCKVLAIRLDIHISELTKLNTNISDFIGYLTSYIKRHYLTKRVGYVWVREIEKSKKQHYHLHLFIDGNKVRTSHHIVSVAKKYLNKKGMTLHHPDKCYSMVYRYNKDSIDEIVYRFSYLAKTRGKGYINKNVRNYSTSQIKDK
jgi:hypothetical protein